jgi:hypothetical protein
MAPHASRACYTVLTVADMYAVQTLCVQKLSGISRSISSAAAIAHVDIDRRLRVRVSMVSQRDTAHESSEETESDSDLVPNVSTCVALN